MKLTLCAFWLVTLLIPLFCYRNPKGEGAAVQPSRQAATQVLLFLSGNLDVWLGWLLLHGELSSLRRGFQLVDAHRCHLELGDLGVGVGGIDGEPVGRGFGEVERDKDYTRLHPFGDEGGQFDMAAAAGDLHPLTVADPHPLRIHHAHHHPRASQLVEPPGLAGHGACVELLQQAAGGEHDGIGLVGQFGGIAERGGHHLPLAAGELLAMEQASAFGRRIVAGPLQPLRSHLVPLDAGVLRSDPADLGGDLLRALIAPVATHCIGDLLDDPPIFPRATRRLEGGGDTLHPPLGVGEVAALLGKGAGGEHHIGQLGSFREEDILHYQKLQLLEPLDDVMLIRIAQHRVFTHHVEPLDAARAGGIYGLGEGKTGRARQVRLLPDGCEAGMHLGVGHLLIAWQAVG